MIKDYERDIRDLRNELKEAKGELADVKAELALFKNWKDKCDRVALKYGSFVMGILTLGAIILIVIEKSWDKFTDLLITWVVK